MATRMREGSLLDQSKVSDPFCGVLSATAYYVMIAYPGAVVLQCVNRVKEHTIRMTMSVVGGSRLLASRASCRRSRFTRISARSQPSKQVRCLSLRDTLSSSVTTKHAYERGSETAASRGFDAVLATSLAFCVTGALVTSFPSGSSETYCSSVQTFGYLHNGEGGNNGVENNFSSVIYVDAAGSGGKGRTSSSKASSTLSLESAKNKDTPYDISIRALKGRRLTMEDEYVVADGGRFCGVFDGHGGGGVSQYLKNHWYRKVCEKLNQTTEELSDASSVSSSAAALRAAFAELEDEILAEKALQYQGSTAVTVMVHEFQGKRTILSANVGDSRAILSRGTSAVDLTRDHKPNEEREKARILSMGESIEWDNVSKVHRVRNLSLSRALGDEYAKPVVSAQVDIQHYPVQETDEFVVLASDGLWDVMTSQDVVSYVHRRMEHSLATIPEGEDRANVELVMRRNMSKWVAREALRRGTADNVCVLMVWLNDVKKDDRR